MSDYNKYWQYEYDVTAKYLIPLLRRWNILSRTSLDVGCGEGGCMCAMNDIGIKNKGFDRDSRRIEIAERMKGKRNCEFKTGDLIEQPFKGERFDIVFLHDVFEHLDQKEKMLYILSSYLTHDGHIVITFPPYYSAFGAHQQLLKFGRIPFIHLIGLWGIISEKDEEIKKLNKEKMGISAFENIVSSAGLLIRAKIFYLISPNYIRFGLHPIGAGLLGKIPFVREVIISGAVYLLSGEK